MTRAALALLVALTVVAQVAARAGVAATRPQLTVVMSSLNNPRKIFLGGAGTVYVVEAGRVAAPKPAWRTGSA